MEPARVDLRWLTTDDPRGFDIVATMALVAMRHGQRVVVIVHRPAADWLRTCGCEAIAGLTLEVVPVEDRAE